MKETKVYVGGKFAGVIKEKRRGFEARTAQSIADRDKSWVRYPSYAEAANALAAWLKRQG